MGLKTDYIIISITGKFKKKIRNKIHNNSESNYNNNEISSIQLVLFKPLFCVWLSITPILLPNWAGY